MKIIPNILEITLINIILLLKIIIQNKKFPEISKKKVNK